MEFLSNELVIVGLFGVLLAVIIVLTWLLSRLLPMLHESVSASNLGRFYDAMLPVVKDTSKAAYETTIAELRRKTNQTATPLDNEMLELIETIVERAIERRSKTDVFSVSSDETTDAAA